jgi:hemerythrin superfamily protein
MPDAIVLLKNDHKTFKKLFRQFEKAGDGAHAERRRIVDEIIAELSKHAVIEEQIFYPTVRKALPGEKSDDMVLEALEEHHIAKWTCNELKDMDPGDERFKAKVTVLIESVEHHIEEEESDLFPEVREAMGRKELQELGAQMEQAREVAPEDPMPKAPDEPPGGKPLTVQQVEKLGDGPGVLAEPRKLFGRRKK